MDTEQDLLVQREQPATLEYRVTSSPGSSRKVNPAGTAAPVTRAKKSAYFSENGYLMKLSVQERQRIEQEIKKRFKPGETCLNDSCTPFERENCPLQPGGTQNLYTKV